MKLKKKQMMSKKEKVPAKLPIVDAGKGEQSSQEHVPKPVPPVTVDKSDKPAPSNGHIVAISSPIRKLKIPKIKREVTEVKTEVKNEKETVNTPYNTIRSELEKEVLSEETGTDVENELNLESKRKRKLPSKYSNAFEVTLNKSNTQ